MSLIMEIKETIDSIISQSEGIQFALIGEIQKDSEIEYYYNAKLLVNNFPQELVNLCQEFYECVDTFSMVIADEIENEIKAYQLKLEYNNMKIFRLEIKKDYVTFFTRYPTHNGFLYDYPE
jgi:hypothetical protein